MLLGKIAEMQVASAHAMNALLKSIFDSFYVCMTIEMDGFVVLLLPYGIIRKSEKSIPGE